MRIFKSHPLLKIINSYLVDSPQPSNLSYLWNFGSLLGLCLVIQIITGVTLAMHYNPSVLEAFNSVEHIMRDVNNGWLIRYLHSNTASAFFFIVYLHIGRGLYYGSYKAPRTLVWTIGTVIFVLMIATAFLGYIHSPTWFKLLTIIKNLLYNNIFIRGCLISYLAQLSFILFYIDGYKLSSCNSFKFIQLLSLITVILFSIYLALVHLNLWNTFCCIKDKGVNLHIHVNVTQDAAK